jgi:phosphoribosylamine---glycine ligase
VLGSGAREHAIIHALAGSPRRPELLCAPGNAGIARDARILEIGADDVDGIVTAARDERIDLVVVGPEAPLVAGVTDALAAAGIRAFGPTAAAARLEGSKAFCKEVMGAAGVPTAVYKVVQDAQAGLDAIERYPVVIKADGLAAGKGVIIAANEDEAREALHALLVDRRFDTTQVVVEEYLEGEELSLLALCDAQRAVPLASAQDYKRIYDGDEGPNTGGMGSYSPVAGIDAAAAEELAATVHQPIVDLMRGRGTPFHGVLYAGLMLTSDGPRVLEFNVRFGDPETQAVLPRLRSDLVELLLACTRPDGLRGAVLEWSEQWAVTIVLASAGYPRSSSGGQEIEGLADVPADVEVTHAGTARRDGPHDEGGPGEQRGSGEDDQAGGGRIVTAGGRVLGVTALGPSARSARAAAYAAAHGISFEGMQMRTDIAADADRETTTVR